MGSSTLVGLGSHIHILNETLVAEGGLSLISTQRMMGTVHLNPGDHHCSNLLMQFFGSIISCTKVDGIPVSSFIVWPFLSTPENGTMIQILVSSLTECHKWMSPRLCRNCHGEHDSVFPTITKIPLRRFPHLWRIWVHWPLSMKDLKISAKSHLSFPIPM